MKCLKCGFETTGNFCNNCGAPLTAASPVNTAHVNNTPASTPVYTAPVNNTPVSTPVYTPPASNIPLNTQPVANAPVYTPPVSNIPLNTQPVANAPVYTPPVNNIPLNTQPIANAPVYTAPENSTPTNAQTVTSTAERTAQPARQPVDTKPQMLIMTSYTEYLAEKRKAEGQQRSTSDSGNQPGDVPFNSNQQTESFPPPPVYGKNERYDDGEEEDFEPQRQKKKRKSIFKRVWFWLIIVLILLGAGGFFAVSAGYVHIPSTIFGWKIPFISEEISETTTQAVVTTVAESTTDEATTAETTTDGETTGTNESEETSEGESTTAKDKKEKKKEYTISDKVIVDNEYCKFTVVSVKEDDALGVTVKALCENKTKNKTLMFSWNNVSVLGYMIDPLFAEAVAAGKKSNVEITFSNDQLEECNIASVDEIEFCLNVYDNENWSADRFVDDVYTVYPTGLTEDKVVYPERNETKKEKIIVDNKKVSFIVQSEEKGSIWGYTLKCYIENKTNKNVTFSWDDVSVNGFMIDPAWACTVSANKREYVEISFSEEDFADNEIKDVDSVEFKLRVSKTDDITADPILSKVYTYAP